MPKAIDMIGQRFGRLVVISRAENSSGGSAMWNCDCDCGETSIVIGGALRSGHTSSCGCLKNEKTTERNFKHGMVGTSTHRIWTGMKQRCTNPNDTTYRNYGGRGITVCERWDKFDNFYADMGKRPKGMSIERKDNNGNYCPENCCWETRWNQARNRRSNRIIKYEGREQCMADWADEFGVDRGTLRQRLNLHPPQIAFNM